MKTLVITNRKDFRLFSLIAPLQEIMEVGFSQFPDENSIREYRPDIILSDFSIDGAYDLKLIGKFPPFVNYSVFREPKLDARFTSDITYLGPLTDIPDLLALAKYNLRHFDSSPSMTPYYSGSIHINNCFTAYKAAKVCPVPANDIGYRELDIIISDGNPVRYENREQFLRDCASGVAGKKFKGRMSKSVILKHHTNYERISEILESIGKRSVADLIKKRKNEN